MGWPLVLFGLVLCVGGLLTDGGGSWAAMVAGGACIGVGFARAVDA